MIKKDQLARKLIAGGVALAMALGVTCASADPVKQVIQVVNVVGDAQYNTMGQGFQTVHAGDVYQPGTIIRTAENSHVDVMLGDEGSAPAVMVSAPTDALAASTGAGAGGGGGGGSDDEQSTANMIRIFPMSVLSVDKLTLDRTGKDETSETQLNLSAGQMMSNTKKLSAQSRYEIKIPNGVASIRGNCNALHVNGECATVFGTTLEARSLPNGNTPVFEIPAHRMLDVSDPNNCRVVDVPDNEWNQLLRDYRDLCFGNRPRDHHHDHDHDHDHDHPSNLSGTP